MRRRVWSIVLHIHADRMATVRVHADTRLLLPICESPDVEQALLYVDAVLGDCHPDDQLLLRAQDLGAVHSLRTTDPALARRWLRERSAELSSPALAAAPPRADPDKHSGTLPIVKEAPGPAKRSAS